MLKTVETLSRYFVHERLGQTLGKQHVGWTRRTGKELVYFYIVRSAWSHHQNSLLSVKYAHQTVYIENRSSALCETYGCFRVGKLYT